MLSDAMKMDIFQFLRSASENRVFLKFCKRFNQDSKIWNFNEHSHPYLELLYFFDGRASVATRSDTLNVALFDLVVYPPGVTHRESLDFSSHNEIVCLWIELESPVTLPFSFKLRDDDGELGWLCQAVNLNHSRKAGHYLELEDYLIKSLLIFMEQKLETVNSSMSTQLDRSRMYIYEHYAEDFDIETLAQVACVSPSYLSRLYKKHFGTSPMRFRNAVRIEKAKRILLVKSLSIEQIASLVGFEDTKYFSQIFKGATSLSPSEFRRKYRFNPDPVKKQIKSKD
jgi:AraC-like DNA-binding protein/mannose-6-phosphate isomerase-like protein (cupin superfamily)